MTVYNYVVPQVFEAQGGTVKVARNATVTATDPLTGSTPAGLTQGGVAVTVLTSDAAGRCVFSATVPSVTIAAPGGLPYTVFSPDAMAAAMSAAVSSDSAVAAYIGTSGAATRTALATYGDARWTTTAAGDARWVPRTTAAEVANLPYPAVFAHAGALNLAPYNSMEALKNAFALAGEFPLDVDVKTLSDGAMPLLHDANTSGVSPTAIAVADLTGGAVRRIWIDPSRWFCNTWTDNLRMPDFTDVLREFGGRRCITAEIETLPGEVDGASGARVGDVIAAMGLQPYVLVQSTSQLNLQALVARGVPICWLSAYNQHGNDINEATAVSVGAHWVGMDNLDPANGAATIARFHGAGLKVLIYTLDRRVDRDLWLGKGADGYWSNDPMWASGTAPTRLTDPFAAQTFWHGHLPASSAFPAPLPRGYFASGGWGIDATATTSTFASDLQGWASPIDNNVGRSFTITWTTTWETAQSAAFSRMDLFLAATDAGWDDSISTKIDGYLISTRQNGQLYVYKSSSTTNTTSIISSALASPTTQAIGTARTFQLTVTPTALTLSVPALGSYSVTTTDSSFPTCGFLHMGLTNAKGRFSAVTIS